MTKINPIEAAKLFKQPDPAPVLSSYEKEQVAMRANYKRLKSERLAREVASKINT